ncbi:lipopolysaccharide-induced tumor necrosis factor-alpha factor homolog [Micropterus dolomieu]|nr:lipopolysaccharide-induced tumor necrosis factor-alpha factor homolog [Micropterus dolomieu]
MQPPSYEEASLQPHNHVLPPPSYDTSLNSPTSPPPSYLESVTIQPDPFPVLTPPRVPTAVTSPSQNTGIIIHPITQIGVSCIQTPTVVTQPQPQPVPISVTHLRDIPGLVRCPHCQHVVRTKVTYMPGGAAWCLCILLILVGLFCGFCLIPLMIRGLQDAHHSCPQCNIHLHTHRS